MTDKWGRRLFQIGGVFLLLLAAIHAISLFEPLHPANETETQLIHLMTDYKFSLMGSPRSMMELFRGFSMAFSLQCMFAGVIALALSKERSAVLKRLSLIVALWLSTLTVVSLTHFFAAPTSFLVVAFLLFTASWLKLPAAPAS